MAEDPRFTVRRIIRETESESPDPPPPPKGNPDFFNGLVIGMFAVIGLALLIAITAVVARH
jgi:hypothetical protein